MKDKYSWVALKFKNKFQDVYIRKLLSVLFFFCFFLDPISQLAVDNSRGILYYRTEQGNLKVSILVPL